ncbi:MAG: type II secretion system protein M [Magnetococcales bacterium]|nr:type II secretion system protein M [Magnetococcales bacterium]
MRGWPGRVLASLGGRERRMVLGGVGVVAGLLVYFLAWLPWSEERERRVELAGEKARVVAEMRRMAGEVTRLRKEGGVPVARPAGGESLLALADRSVRERGLGGALRRVEPEGGDRVVLWLEKARFDEVMAWLVDLTERHGVVVGNLALDREETPGLSRGRVVLARPGKSGDGVF